MPDPATTDVAGPGGRREQRRRRHGELGRRHLLDAAEEVFSRKGFHDATMKEIAELAEFSVGAVYGFFENKDDLFVQLMERHGTEFLARMRAAVGDGESPATHLHNIVDMQVGYFRENPRFGRLFQRAIGAAFWNMQVSLDPASFARYREIVAIEAGVFERGVAAGELRPGEPEALATIFSGMMQAFQARELFGSDAGDGRGVGGFSDDDLHDLIDAAFVVRRRRPRRLPAG